MSGETKVDIEKLAEIIALSIKDLTKEELEKLIATLKDKYGIEPTVQVVEVAAAEEVVEEKTSFSLILKDLNGKKLALTKVWKNYSGLGLKETMGIFNDPCPITLKENLDKTAALQFKTELEAAGGIIEIV